jgi:chromosome segregation ATPase
LKTEVLALGSAKNTAEETQARLGEELAALGERLIREKAAWDEEAQRLQARASEIEKKEAELQVEYEAKAGRIETLEKALMAGQAELANARGIIKELTARQAGLDQALQSASEAQAQWQAKEVAWSGMRDRLRETLASVKAELSTLQEERARREAEQAVPAPLPEEAAQALGSIRHEMQAMHQTLTGLKRPANQRLGKAA